MKIIQERKLYVLVFLLVITIIFVVKNNSNNDPYSDSTIPYMGIVESMNEGYKTPVPLDSVYLNNEELLRIVHYFDKELGEFSIKTFPTDRKYDECSNIDDSSPCIFTMIVPGSSEEKVIGILPKSQAGFINSWSGKFRIDDSRQYLITDISYGKRIKNTYTLSYNLATKEFISSK